MATINNKDKETFARSITSGIRAIASKRGRKILDVAYDLTQNTAAEAPLAIAARTLQSWKSPSSVPGTIDDDKLWGLAWMVLEEGNEGLDWLTGLLRATSIAVPDPPTSAWLRACLAQVLVYNKPPPAERVDHVVGRLFPAAQPVAPAPSDEQVKAYCRLLREAFGPWEELYVDPQATELHDPPASLRPGRSPRQAHDAALRRNDHVYEQMGLPRRDPIQSPLVDWFWERQRMALLAVPGCGKTTALQEMAGHLAQWMLAAGPDWQSLPVFISLGDYGDSSLSLAEFLAEGVRRALQRSLVGWGSRDRPQEQAEVEAYAWIDQAWSPLAPFLEPLRRAGRLTLLLDSLNELPGGAEGPLRPAVETFVAQSKAWGNRVAVACRVADYHSRIAELDRVELLPFDLERSHQALVKHVSEAESQAEGERLWAELGRPENLRLRDLLEIPLYIEVLSWSLKKDAAGRYRLPANRGDLLDGFVRSLLARERERTGTTTWVCGLGAVTSYDVRRKCRPPRLRCAGGRGKIRWIGLFLAQAGFLSEANIAQARALRSCSAWRGPLILQASSELPTFRQVGNSEGRRRCCATAMHGLRWSEAVALAKRLGRVILVELVTLS